MADLLALTGVSKTYHGRIKALSDVSLSLAQGECLVLLGPNGAGKTTLIKILTRLIRPDAGEIRAPHRRSFGVALQEIGLWPHLTVSESIAFIGRLYGIPSPLLEKRKKALLSQLELSKFQELRFDRLSDGLKRRLNLACALVHEPNILVLDEPSLGLDVHARRSLWKILDRLLKEKITLLVSTHDMEEAERLGRRIGILDHGTLRALDSAHGLKQAAGRGDEIRFKFSPPHALSDGLFSRIPGFVSGTAEDGKAHFFLRDGIGRFPGLVTSFAEAGIRIADVEVKPAGLADVFLSITGHPLD